MFNDIDMQRHAGKFYGKYSGEVTDNNDPDMVGKVKVTVPSVFGTTMEVWARPCLPFAHFFIPSTGTKVWIEFEAGNPSYPIWVGIWYTSGSVPPEADITPPDNRVIQTPSGHTIEIMDKDGEEKITIKHNSNSFVSIDKNGSVTISNQKGSHLFLNSDKEEATFMEQHGHLMTMTRDGVIVTNNEGVLLELKGDMARVMATNIVLQGTSVALGANAMEPTIMGQSFMSKWNMLSLHTHATALGPSGPPLPPVLPLVPGIDLTSSVVVK